MVAILCWKITHGTKGSNKDGIYYQLAHFAQKVADPCIPSVILLVVTFLSPMSVVMRIVENNKDRQNLCGATVAWGLLQYCVSSIFRFDYNKRSTSASNYNVMILYVYTYYLFKPHFIIYEINLLSNTKHTFLSTYLFIFIFIFIFFCDKHSKYLKIFRFKSLVWSLIYPYYKDKY